ncbi:MAG TPA: tRNA pseudouridine(55) synthase TruB, partial [Candidatus Gallimonas gallistercoris]|nr:tRNA pseudouridine(55) synthase TruB [Candidatus Gallimonas gallistercoris]
TGAYMSGLLRERSGPFSLETAVHLKDLTPENVEEHLIPTDSVLPFPSLTVEDTRYFQGVRLPCAHEDGLYKIYSAEGFYGLGRVEGGELRPEKKLC